MIVAAENKNDKQNLLLSLIASLYSIHYKKMFNFPLIKYVVHKYYIFCVLIPYFLTSNNTKYLKHKLCVRVFVCSLFQFCLCHIFVCLRLKQSNLFNVQNRICLDLKPKVQTDFC